MEGQQPKWFAETLTTLLEKRDLTPGVMRLVMEDWLAGRCGETETAALLVALRMKGETAAELAEAAQVLRDKMIPLETGREDALDTCGTGGDGSHTFNISTAVALVVAGAGVPVVKHGNRAASSRSGSADVLSVLGVQVEGTAAAARRSLDEVGLAFCFAPHFHPTLRQLAPVRRRLNIRTIFNCLGPLANPARTAYQLMGVGSLAMLDLMAGALARLGTARRALLVCSRDGLDEVSLSAPTLVRAVCGPRVTEWEWAPEQFNLGLCSLADLRAEGPEQSAAIIRVVLEGQDGPPRRIVLANAGAALLAAERVETLADGVEKAAQAIDSGAARRVLKGLVELSQMTTIT